MDEDIVFNTLKNLLVSNFEVEAELITPEKHLEKDLGLDSLDMVDCILYLKDNIGEKVDPGLFKNARTVKNVVDLLKPLWK